MCYRCIWLVIKLQMNLQNSSELHDSIIQKQLQMNKKMLGFIKKYLKKNMYPQKEDKKLLMI